jgi:dTDP-4-dehydrorhamnose reductase
VKAIATADYPTQAVRPANSRLNCALIERLHGVALPDWRTSLEGMVMPLHSIFV